MSNLRPKPTNTRGELNQSKLLKYQLLVDLGDAIQKSWYVFYAGWVGVILLVVFGHNHPEWLMWFSGLSLVFYIALIGFFVAHSLIKRRNNL